MPQFKIKIRNIDDNQTESVSVWASDKRTAVVQAIKIAKTVLGTDNLEVT